MKMIELLLVLSFILHGILLFFVIILSLRFSRLKEMERKQESMIKEMGETVSAYILETKEQNEQFIQKLKQVDSKMLKQKQEVTTKSQEPHAQSPFEDKSVPTKEDFQNLLTENHGKEIVNRANGYYRKSLKERVNAPKEEETVPVKDFTELTSEEIKKMAISLQKKGLTIEEIAKYLHRGKVEIELMLRFHQKL